jgi:4'-phosphopantetheinyl transferase
MKLGTQDVSSRAFMNAEAAVLRSAFPLDLAEGEIHVWLTDYGGIRDEALERRYRTLLSAPERDQERRFYFARDRLRYLVTRALVRTVLSRYLPLPPPAWRFETNDYGRPHIANPIAGAERFKFNISHTHSLIALGITRGGALGVDVENFRARAISIDVADRYFAPEEVAALAGVPQDLQQYRFFEYWTFKEAYIKARGMGLSLPLDKFSFHYAHDADVQLAIEPELADDPRRWRLWQLRPQSDYLLALCAERSEAPMNISLRHCVPLVTEQLQTPQFVRASM